MKFSPKFDIEESNKFRVKTFLWFLPNLTEKSNVQVFLVKTHFKIDKKIRQISDEASPWLKLLIGQFHILGWKAR